ncbi:Hypothetical predicted protein [Mytilus galloprovincialis]|uniref:DUF6589 domain-containing protein n=1 Tax=Mytilus galloprovincialis TaxID=29158 RepID=A0A8B6H0B0_MYTGA|nr:Hypothetical predicted protein [Mytilus galloprovincialis]
MCITKTPCRYRTKKQCVRTTSTPKHTKKQCVRTTGTPKHTKKQCVRTTGTPKHTMKQFVHTSVKLQLKSKKHSSDGYKRTASIYLSASRYSNVFKTLIKNSKAARTAFKKIVVSEAFTRLNHLGITLGTDATRGAVDKIRQGFSKDLTEMKEHLTRNNRAAVQIRRRLFDEEDEEGDEEGVAILDDTLPYAEESDNEDANPNNGRDEDATSLNDTIPFEDEDEVEAFLADDLQEAVMITPAERQGLVEVNEDLMVVNEVDNEEEVPENELCLYSLVFDNVNKHLHAKQTSREKGNIIKNMVQAYAAVDRIPTGHLDDKQPTPAEVAEIPCTVFLTNEEEVKTIRFDYVQQVKEVLVANIPCFQNLEYEDYRVHLYEQHSSRKSNLIPLGVLDKDEAIIAEMIDIMEDYHQYVPGTRDENPVIIPLFRDGLRVERGFDAQDARINAGDPWQQLQGLHPSIQEWHKRGILLQMLLWRGIGEMIRHKAIRSNNGPKMLMYWKEDMVEFFKMGHTKYFLCGLRLLMDTHGALSLRIAKQLTWNRTVNVHGGVNRNIEMDLQMEFFNKELKESLKDAGGNIST